MAWAGHIVKIEITVSELIQASNSSVSKTNHLVAENESFDKKGGHMVVENMSFARKR